MAAIVDGRRGEGGGGDDGGCGVDGGNDDAGSGGGGIDSDGEDNSKYQRREYWEKRFAKEESYEWLCGFDHVEKYIHRDIARDQKIIVVGCGNSPFSAAMHAAGYENMVSTDFSPVVIQAMEIRYPMMKWEVADVTNLSQYPDGTFDVVIDKACLDALVVDEGDVWSPNEGTIARMRSAILSIRRVLKPDGQFISIGFQQPHFRERYFSKERLGCSPVFHDIQVFNIDAGLGYFYLRTRPRVGADGCAVSD